MEQVNTFPYILKLKESGFDFDTLPIELQEVYKYLNEYTDNTLLTDNEKINLLMSKLFSAIATLQMNNEVVQEVVSAKRHDEAYVVNDGFNTPNLVEEELVEVKENQMDNKNNRWIYTLTQRPFGIGTYPTDNFIEFVENYEHSPYGQLAYSSPVSLNDMNRFEISPVTQIEELTGRIFESDFGGDVFYFVPVMFIGDRGKTKVRVWATGGNYDTWNAVDFLIMVDNKEYFDVTYKFPEQAEAIKDIAVDISKRLNSKPKVGATVSQDVALKSTNKILDRLIQELQDQIRLLKETPEENETPVNQFPHELKKLSTEKFTIVDRPNDEYPVYGISINNKPYYVQRIETISYPEWKRVEFNGKYWEEKQFLGYDKKEALKKLLDTYSEAEESKKEEFKEESKEMKPIEYILLYLDWLLQFPVEERKKQLHPINGKPMFTSFDNWMETNYPVQKAFSQRYYEMMRSYLSKDEERQIKMVNRFADELGLKHIKVNEPIDIMKETIVNQSGIPAKNIVVGGIPKQKFKETDPTTALRKVAGWIPKEQLRFIEELIKGEEGEFFLDKMNEVAETIEKLPSYNGSEPDPLVLMHYFRGASDWYIFEYDRSNSTDGYIRAYGFTIRNGDYINADNGTIPICTPKTDKVGMANSICGLPVEIDLHWQPKRLSRIKAELYGEEKVLENTIIQEEAPASKRNEPEINTSNASRPATDITKVVRELVDEKGDDRSKYSQQDIELLRAYEGLGAKRNDKEYLATLGISNISGIRYEYYTPLDVIQKMWGLAYKHGYKPSNSNVILEPSCGTGRFFNYIENVQKQRVIGFDIDRYALNITKVLYPFVEIMDESFTKGYTGVGKVVDLVIGNPPYDTLRDKEDKKATKSHTLDQLFMYRSAQLLKKGGLLVFIVPNSFMNNEETYNDFKDKLIEIVDLVDAYRLPNKVFAKTDIGTDILVFKKK